MADTEKFFPALCCSSWVSRHVSKISFITPLHSQTHLWVQSLRHQRFKQASAFKQISVEVIYEPCLNFNEKNSLRACKMWGNFWTFPWQAAWLRFVRRGDGTYCLNWLSGKKESYHHMLYARMITNTALKTTVQYNNPSLASIRLLWAKPGYLRRWSQCKSYTDIGFMIGFNAREVNITLLSLHVRYKMKIYRHTSVYASTKGDDWISVFVKIF